MWSCDSECPPCKFSSCSCSRQQRDVGRSQRHCDIYQEYSLLVLLYTTTISGRLCSVTWSVWILTSQRILTFSVANTGSAVCRYHSPGLGRPNSSGQFRRLCHFSSYTSIKCLLQFCVIVLRWAKVRVGILP